MIRLVSVQTGTPRTVGTPHAEDSMERAFTSAIFEVIDRPNPEWTVRRAAQAMQAREREPAPAADLARCRGLSEGWRSRLAGRGISL